MQTERLVYSIPEVEEALHLSHQSIYNLLNSGQLRSFTVGKRRFVSRNALKEFVEDREAESIAS